jgi:DNA invertase Pin-like site-specific DNA recombinase
VIGTRRAEKVTTQHLARDAYLYVRQSSMRQVIENTESATRQYALRQRAVALGWPLERIIVIDQDQAQSGASAADREGFQRLVAEVGIGKAGIVLGLEVSRLARNNADWHRLLEICGLCDTLILDEDGLYDPTDFNDRLLLGLKGAMSEAELHILRSRLRGGILSKARRGELKTPLPIGLVYDPAGKVVLDPDAAVRAAVAHLFEVFERTGAARATVREFADRKLLFPQRVHSGERKGELVWSPLAHDRVLHALHNPRYAGAFFFGRRQTRQHNGKRTQLLVPREEWIVLIEDAHPGYISFAQFERNQATLQANASARGTDRHHSPPREGPALLQGLVVCGRCGKRMAVRYHHRRGQPVPDYACERDAIKRALHPACQIVAGERVDQAVGELLLKTLTPLALEVALEVAAELEQRAEQADQLRQRHVERARYDAELARRRYLAVDPDNRLVADALEADWNDKLRQLQAAQDDYDRARANGNGRLTAEQRAKVMALAQDFPRLWADPATPQRERKRMIRLLIDDVTLLRDQQITAHVRLKGGQTRTLTLPLPLTIGELRHTSPELIQQIDRLLDEHTEGEIAKILNRQGERSFEGKPFTATIVQRLRASHQLATRHQRLRARGMLTRPELATQLGVHIGTIHDWRVAGLLAAHKANDRPEWLYEPVAANDPRLTSRRGWRLSNREPNPTTPGGAV